MVQESLKTPLRNIKMAPKRNVLLLATLRYLTFSYYFQFLMDEDTLLIPGIVEKVNSKMLSYLYENDDKLVVFFYDPTDRDADDIIDGLEQIDELLDADNVSLVIIDEEDAAEPYGILDLPALVLIQNGIPNFYEEDDLLNHRYVLIVL